jgi:Zn-dependent protease/CBS domain-containing protein
VAFVVFLGADQATRTAPGLAPAIHWLVGAAVGLTFLATVVAHELAHALVGRRRGVPVSRIHLDFGGGVAPMGIQAARPRDELLIALSGPLVSLAVGAVLVPVAVATAMAGGSFGLVGGALLVVGGLNVVLAILSLLPGMPLDGGRIVRAIAWAASGDRDRAARVTARIGQALGWGLVGAGVVLALNDMITGAMLTLGMGWFLATGAGTLMGRADVERLLRGATVADATWRDVPRLAPGLTVDTFADRFTGEDRTSCLPVMEGDTVLGVIGARQVRRLGRSKASVTRAADLVQAPPAAPFLAPGDDLWTSVELMNRLGVDGLAVVEAGVLEGVVMRESIGELMVRRGAEPAGRRP